MRWKVNYWDMFFGFLLLSGVVLLMLVGIGHAISMDNKEQEFAKQKKEYLKFTSLSSFCIYYIDGRKEYVESESCVYGQTDDKIYFLSKSGKDTLKIVPKIEVEQVTTLDKNKAK